MLPEEEKRLLKKAKGGDDASFEKLITDCSGSVYGLALKMMKNPEDAEDASQEAMLKAWRGLPAFKGECRFSSWLFRLTYNTCLDMLRKRRPGLVLSLTEQEEDGEEGQTDVADPAPGPEERLLQRERAETIRREMERLPDKLKEPLLLREMGGRSYEEIARTLDISLGTVKSRICRARQTLAEALKKDGTFFPAERPNQQRGGDRT